MDGREGGREVLRQAGTCYALKKETHTKEERRKPKFLVEGESRITAAYQINKCKLAQFGTG